jgi:predicted ribosome quality control (RQC) complex YloA/Tae2 family protein
MAQSVSNHFHAALSYLLAQEGRGAQSRLASQQNIDRGYLNAIVKGRKPGAEEVRAKIASHFDMTYEDMLALGRRILGGEEDVISERVSGRKQKTATRSDVALDERRTIEYKSPQKSGGTQPSISEKIMKVVEILESATTYSTVLAELVDAFHEAISTKKENLALRNQMKEMEARIASLEKILPDKKDGAQKSA